MFNTLCGDLLVLNAFVNAFKTTLKYVLSFFLEPIIKLACLFSKYGLINSIGFIEFDFFAKSFIDDIFRYLGYTFLTNPEKEEIFGSEHAQLKLTFGQEEKKAINDVLDSGRISEGKKVKEFENIWAKYLKSKYCVATSSGSGALITGFTALKYYYKLPAIIVDFGTAITVDIVSGKGEYLGGIISPGINMMLKALHENTALLPFLQVEPVKNFLGKDTKSSILSGIFNGIGFLVDGFITGFKNQIEPEAIVIATGGYNQIMKKFCKNIQKFDNLLTLKGIEKAYFFKKKLKSTGKS